MNAITVHQPYAELIARGDTAKHGAHAKFVENRRWPTRHRGLLAIHAGKSRDWFAGDSYGVKPDEVVYGAVVAVAWLDWCWHLDTTNLVQRRKDEAIIDDRYRWLRGHEHVEGPYCWVLTHVKRLETPLPMNGRQGLWLLPENASPALERAAQAVCNLKLADRRRAAAGGRADTVSLLGRESQPTIRGLD